MMVRATPTRGATPGSGAYPSSETVSEVANIFDVIDAITLFSNP